MTLSRRHEVYVSAGSNEVVFVHSHAFALCVHAETLGATSSRHECRMTCRLLTASMFLPFPWFVVFAVYFNLTQSPSSTPTSHPIHFFHGQARDINNDSSATVVYARSPSRCRPLVAAINRPPSPPPPPSTTATRSTTLTMPVSALGLLLANGSNFTGATS